MDGPLADSSETKNVLTYSNLTSHFGDRLTWMNLFFNLENYFVEANLWKNIVIYCLYLFVLQPLIGIYVFSTFHSVGCQKVFFKLVFKVFWKVKLSFVSIMSRTRLFGLLIGQKPELKLRDRKVNFCLPFKHVCKNIK